MEARLIFDPPASGSWNMAVDEALFQLAQNSRQLAIRFYEWSEPTLSLGYFQPADARDSHAPSRNCPLVRRSTGGGAIVHDQELTYSIVFPLANDRSAQSDELVRLVHQSLIETLKGWGVFAHFDEGLSPTRGTLVHSEPFLCFQRRALDDVFLQGNKIAGSAQRKLHRTLLQHGSVLLRRSAQAPELPGISELAHVDLSASQLAQRWAVEIAKALRLRELRQNVCISSGESGLDPQLGSQSSAVNSIVDFQELAREIETNKFASNQWNRKR